MSGHDGLFARQLPIASATATSAPGSGARALEGHGRGDPAYKGGQRERLRLLALMIFTFARVGASLRMRVEDVYAQGRRTWVRLHEKGGKRRSSLLVIPDWTSRA
jgi:hypothetical protein